MNESNVVKVLTPLIPYIIILISVIIVRTFIVTPVIVNGSSMFPTLKDKNILILNKYDKKYERFDIVVLDKDKEKLIKRVIGLPGDTIEYKGYNLYVNGKKIEDKFAEDTAEYYLTDEDFNLITIPEDKYFVLGDNRNNSIDSRTFGLVDSKNIEGTVRLSLLPFKNVNK